jgi:hypothetical protein
MAPNLKLFCWVLNISHRPFPVNIAGSETVGGLAAKIVEQEPQLRGIASNNLELWKVSDSLLLVQLLLV